MHPLGVEDGDGDWPRPDLSGGGPVLAAQWDKSDMEALGLTRLDVYSSRRHLKSSRRPCQSEPSHIAYSESATSVYRNLD
jgi:hypothetical protein